MKKFRMFRNVRIGLAVIVAGICAAAWSGFFPETGRLLHIQFGPAFLSLFALFSAGAAATVALIALLSFAFGRFYCSFLCPAGIWQDFSAWIFRRKNAETRNLKKTRYVVTGVVVGMLAGGSAAGFMFLDPYSNFGRAASSFSLGAAVPLVVLTVLAIWKRRMFCATFCPVGTMLGLCAKKGVYRLSFNEKCVKCGLCAKSCPAGCMDPASGKIDNERCVRCLNCLAVCRRNAVVFGREKNAGETDGNRRAFLTGAGVFTAAAACGFTLAKTGLSRFAAAVEKAILPPGAGDAGRFASRCTSCLLCVKNCPAKIIRPAKGGYGPVSLDLSSAECRYYCHKCSEVCPTGAIRPLSLEEKQSCQIARARIDKEKCVSCGLCARTCPAGAIAFSPEQAGRTPPVVDGTLCIGCGACSHACPVEAIDILPIEKQSFVKTGR